MNLSARKRALLGVLSFAAVTGLAIAGFGGASSYFSDLQQGNIHGNGSVGSIKGATNTNDLAYSNLLPGEVQTVSAKETNVGKNSQDVYLVFNNADALHSLNDLGRYGEFHIAANGHAVFDSANLNDNTGGTCGPISPSGCWPVAKMYKLESNVAPGGTVDYSFSFGYAARLMGQSAAGGGDWNTYSGGTGLPYQIVEVQVGQTP